MTNIITKNGKVAKRFTRAIKALQNQQYKVYRYHLKGWAGSRRYMRLDDIEHQHYLAVCEAFGLCYTVGNDAPRGGVTGDYIEVTVDKRKKFYKTCFNF